MIEVSFVAGAIATSITTAVLGYVAGMLQERVRWKNLVQRGVLLLPNRRVGYPE